MPYSIVVEFDLGEPFTEVWSGRVHRVLNLSEELNSAFRAGDLASHEIQNQATSRLVVNVRSKNKLRRVAAIVDQLRLRHFPDDISRLATERTQRS